MNPSLPSVAVIGAGMAGLVFAAELNGRADVTVFEKSRGPGGRMSTRHQEETDYDHGAQYFTARGRRFKKFLQPYLTSGDVAVWDARITTLTGGSRKYKRMWFEPHYTGSPGMNRLCQAISQTLTCHAETKILPLSGDGPPWNLVSESAQDLGHFDWVVSTAPAFQSAQLLPDAFSGQSELARTVMSGCNTLMLRLESDPAVTWDAAVVKDSCLEWLAFNHRKPGHDLTRPAMIVHSTNAWAEETRGLEDGEVAEHMMEEMLKLTELPRAIIQKTTVHRWRFAAVETAAGTDFLWDGERQLAACGDWCLGSRVEAAFLSATRLAKKWNNTA